jgi:hypothetical protein
VMTVPTMAPIEDMLPNNDPSIWVIDLLRVVLGDVKRSMVEDGHAYMTPMLRQGKHTANKRSSTESVGQVRVCNVYYVLDRVNCRDGFSMKKPFRTSARVAGFHTKYASNANVGRVVVFDANSYLAL